MNYDQVSPQEAQMPSQKQNIPVLILAPKTLIIHYEIIGLISILCFIGFHILGWTCLRFDTLYETQNCTVSISGHRYCYGWTKDQYASQTNDCAEISDPDCSDLLRVKQFLVIMLSSSLDIIILCIIGFCIKWENTVCKFILHFVSQITILLVIILSLMQAVYFWNISVKTTSGMQIITDSYLHWKFLGMSILILFSTPILYCLQKLIQDAYQNPDRQSSILRTTLRYIFMSIMAIWICLSLPCYIAYQVISWMCWSQDNLFQTEECVFTMNGDQVCSGWTTEQYKLFNQQPCLGQLSSSDCQEIYSVWYTFWYVLLASQISPLSFLVVFGRTDPILILFVPVSWIITIIGPALLLSAAEKLINMNILSVSGTNILIDTALQQKLTATGGLLLGSLPTAIFLFLIAQQRNSS